MSEPVVPNTIVCPYCNEDPMRISSAELFIGQVVLMLAYCGNPNCRKLITASFVGFQQPASGIVLPGPGRIQ